MVNVIIVIYQSVQYAKLQKEETEFYYLSCTLFLTLNGS